MLLSLCIQILKNPSKLVWETIVDHAKKCDPGRTLYSHFIEDKDIRLYFSSVGQIVGATIANQYNAFDDAYLSRNKVCFYSTYLRCLY
jgi:hypothetical protein